MKAYASTPAEWRQGRDELMEGARAHAPGGASYLDPEAVETYVSIARAWNRQLVRALVARRPDDRDKRAAQPEDLRALLAEAVRALNTVPNFRYDGSTSYALAARIDAILARV